MRIIKKINCSRCGLPGNWSLTRFNAQGICNFCLYYDTVKHKLRDFKRWNKSFRDHLDTHKGKFQYDAVVGFSGGKDSSYIIHKLTQHYGYKILAVTVNFGFMPTQFAIENSKRVVRKLNVDHYIYDATDPQTMDGFKQSIKMGQFCSLCTALCTAFTRKVALNKGIPFIILGADRGQMLRELSPETRPVSGAAQLASMVLPYSAEKTWQSEPPVMEKNIRRWLTNFGYSKQTTEDIYPSAKPLPGTEAKPLTLQFFAFHDYHEDKIKNTLVDEADWTRPKNDHLHAHHDCIFHDANMYALRKANNSTITMGEICVDVREGCIPRQAALDVLEKEALKLNSIEKPWAVFEDYFGLQENDILPAIKKVGKRIRLLKRLRKLQLLFYKSRIKAFDRL